MNLKIAQFWFRSVTVTEHCQLSIKPHVLTARTSFVLGLCFDVTNLVMTTVGVTLQKCKSWSTFAEKSWETLGQNLLSLVPKPQEPLQRACAEGTGVAYSSSLALRRKRKKAPPSWLLECHCFCCLFVLLYLVFEAENDFDLLTLYSTGDQPRASCPRGKPLLAKLHPRSPEHHHYVRSH